MTLQYFNVEQCPKMSWKNGGGTTREIACQPPHSDLSHFNWRISIADINQNGPFSSFEGIDRTIMLLQGQQVHLKAKDGSFDHQLVRPLEPFSFSGEVGLDCTLQAGSTQDFNVMTRREVCTSVTQIVRQEKVFQNVCTCVLLAAQGSWHVAFNTAQGLQQETLTSHDGLWWSENAQHFTLSPISDDAAMIVVMINDVKEKIE